MRRGAASAAALLVVGCASTPDRRGFDDVRGLVAERLGENVSWTRGADEDAEAERAVDALLAKPLTADAAVQIALLADRGLQAQYERLGVAQADVVQAGLLRNPVFDVAYRVPAPDGARELEGSVVTDFLQVLFLPARRQTATAAFEAVKLRVTSAVLDVAARTRETFLRHQADMQLLELHRQTALATAAAYEAAKALHAAGNVRDLDLDEERALHDRSLLRQADAETAVARGRGRLNAAMGLWGTKTTWTIATRLPDVPAETLDLADLEKRAVAASLDLAAERKEIESAAAALGVADASRLFPEASVGVAGLRAEGRWSAGPTVSLPLPLFDQGQARAAAAASELRRRFDAYHALAVDVRAAARDAAQAFLSARSKALFRRDESLPLATRLLNESQLEYDAMQIGVFQLLAAKEREIDAARGFVEATRDYWLARAEIARVLAGGSPRFGAATGGAGEPERGGMDEHGGHR